MEKIKETYTAKEFREKFVLDKGPKKAGAAKMMRKNEPIMKAALYFRGQNINCIREYGFHHTRKWRFDLAFPDHKIAIEYEGIVSKKSRHTTIKGYSADCDKYNEAAAMGWKILRFTARNASGMITKIEKLLYEKGS